MLDGTATLPSNLTVTKEGSQYPGYFYKPKENLFEGKRGSRYDSTKPRTFNLTQPDTTLARFVFQNQERNKRDRDTQSMNAYNSPAGVGLASNASLQQRSPKSVANAYKTS